MTVNQKIISITTLVMLAGYLHLTFCEWKTRVFHQARIAQHGDARVVLPLGRVAGIYARSLRTYEVDAVLGIALPVSLIGWSFYLLAAPLRKSP